MRQIERPRAGAREINEANEVRWAVIEQRPCLVPSAFHRQQNAKQHPNARRSENGGQRVLLHGTFHTMFPAAGNFAAFTVGITRCLTDVVISFANGVTDLASHPFCGSNGRGSFVRDVLYRLVGGISGIGDGFGEMIRDIVGGRL